MSAWPRAFQGRFVTFIELEVAGAEVDIVLSARLGKREDMEARRGLNRARMTARTAMAVAIVFVDKNVVDGVSGCCALVVSVIEKVENQSLGVPQKLL